MLTVLRHIPVIDSENGRRTDIDEWNRNKKGEIDEVDFKVRDPEFRVGNKSDGKADGLEYNRDAENPLLMLQLLFCLIRIGPDGRIQKTFIGDDRKDDRVRVIDGKNGECILRKVSGCDKRPNGIACKIEHMPKEDVG